MLDGEEEMMQEKPDKKTNKPDRDVKPSAVKESPMKGVTMLKLGDKASLLRVKEELIIYFRTQFEDAGNFLISDKYYEVPKVDKTVFNKLDIEAKTKTAIMEKVMEKLAFENIKKQETLEVNKKKIYGGTVEADYEDLQQWPRFNW